MQRVLYAHAHKYYDIKFPQNQCMKPPSAEALQEMRMMTKAHRDGNLDPKLSDLLKRYITVHCQRCCDPNCKVPHMAAGW